MMALESRGDSMASCVQSWFMQMVRDGARTDPSQPGDGAVIDCCWLKSVPQVYQCDVMILLSGRHPKEPSAGKIKDSSSCLVSVQPHPYSLS